MKPVGAKSNLLRTSVKTLAANDKRAEVKLLGVKAKLLGTMCRGISETHGGDTQPAQYTAPTSGGEQQMRRGMSETHEGGI